MSAHTDDPAPDLIPVAHQAQRQAAAAIRQARHARSVAEYHALRDAIEAGRAAGARECRAELVQSPLAAVMVLREALEALSCSDDTALRLRLLAESVADDVATASKPDHLPVSTREVAA